MALGDGRVVSISEAVGDDDYLAPGSSKGDNGFVHQVQYRGAAVIAARGLSSAMYVCYNPRTLFMPTSYPITALICCLCL